MIDDREIWRAAHLLINRYGADAELIAAQRADEMIDLGDRDGQLIWVWIRRAVAALSAEPSGAPH